MAGVLWGGFQDPHTRLSAIYQVVNAALILITIAVYTANLAACACGRPRAHQRESSVALDSKLVPPLASFRVMLPHNAYAMDPCRSSACCACVYADSRVCVQT